MSSSVLEDAYSAFVCALVEERRRAGVTQVELADRLGKRQQYVSNIERCGRRLDVLEFYKYARALGVDPAELFGRLAKLLSGPPPE
jgi:transcriptional regulator with XRE-family HTH domain